MSFTKLKQDLKALGNKEKAKHSERFFKTGKGEYGEGDKFLGITVPEQRKVVKKYFKDLSIKDTEKLLQSKIHEHRLTAVLILVTKFQKLDEKGKKEIIDMYLRNTKYLNNWDIIDSSAHKILGEYYMDHPEEKPLLYKFAKSKDLWEKRIAIMSTFTFIRANQYEDALKISEILLHDDHDLIHKAVGWMLREIGNRDLKPEESFLKKHYKTMPRTMLRYAIEKLPEDKRKFYMQK